ncbi:hypothetical protein [Methanonatronarchaeum sp. AMET-Sl]|uniref:arsenic resistance protein n=1 Tax=Methanonatronarchaeum sp. AMET-Sl TaxID=3037654 RepID=UPI00244DE4C8|nr:hypothetical protein [Methanonatronarchaeum sp. AMET-Sl]WGI17912.1 hypothetical protein QEN48_02580 [Methanonatronarchaeum sp. AMET-Sl]
MSSWSRPLLIFFSIVIGYFLGLNTLVRELSGYLIMPFLILMLYIVFLQVPLKDFGDAFKGLRFTGSALLFNFIWNPILAFLIGSIFLSNQPELLLGFILLMVTPCTDWYLVFTSLAKGDVASCTALLPWNLVLQLLLLPIYLIIFAGITIDINYIDLFNSIIIVLLIPFIIAITSRKTIKSKLSLNWFNEKLRPKLGFFEFGFLLLAITSIFAYQGTVLVREINIMVYVVSPIFLFLLINFFLGNFFYLKGGWSYEKSTCLTFTIMARNSPLALAIAYSVFPDNPLIYLVLVIAPLIELPTLSIASQLNPKIKNQKNKTT